MFEFERNLAVIIGIDTYGQGIPSLTTAANDAKKIAQLLQDEHQYHQVWTFLDADATQERLDELFQKTLPNTVQANDRLVFYFAGHGIALPGEEGPQGYLIPQDAKLGDSTTYIRMTDVEKALTQLSCRHCLVILDCCFAGAFRWASTRDIAVVPESIYKERYDRFIADPAWQVITSAAYDQKALDSLKFIEDSDRGNIDGIDGQHSPFATALIEALGGKADAFPPAQDDKPAGDGIITATEMYLYLRDRVEKLTEKQNKRQTPGLWLLKKHDKGEYIFLTQDFKRDKLEDAPSLDDQEGNNPYRGLKSYEKEHADLFFGRTSLTEKLCDFVNDIVNEKNRQLTIVLGASGSGKSSLVKAGLIPHLADHPNKQSQKRDLNQKIQAHQHKQQTWHILPVIRPSESPLNSLSTAFKDIVPTGSEVDFTEAIVSWGEQHPDSRILLTIDQFEELITQCKDESERKEFLALLANALQAYPNFSLLLTLRSDFEPQFRDTALEADWKEARFIVPAMTREELREVIEEPASAKVVFFKPHELIEQLIDEVAQMPGALPLLSFALSELYLLLAQRYLDAQKKGKIVERAITQSDYDDDKFGGVTRSLTQRADREYEDLLKEDPAYEQTIRHVMLRMLAVGGELARRRVYFSELEYPEPENGRVKEVIKRFDTARLLTSDKDDEGLPYVEPAHDVLVRGWKRLSDWKQKEDESLLLQRRLTPAAVEWDSVKNKDKDQPKGVLDVAEPVLNGLDRMFFSVENLVSKIPVQFARLLRLAKNQQVQLREKPTQFLWDGSPYLGLLDKELHSDDNWLNQVESSFIQESVLKKRRNISWRWRIAIGVILGLSGLTLSALYQAQLSSLREKSAIVINRLSTNAPIDGLILAIDATGQNQFWLPWNKLGTVQSSLLSGLEKAKESNRFTIKEGGRIEVGIFSPDGNYIATGDGLTPRGSPGDIPIDGNVWLRDLQGNPISKPMYHKGGVQYISFSSDGKYIASQDSENEYIKIWDLQGNLIRNESYQLFCAISNTKSNIGCNNSKIKNDFISIDNEKVLFLQGSTGSNIKDSLSKDGKYLAKVSRDRIIVQVVNNGNNKESILTNLRGCEGEVKATNFSQDDRSIIGLCSDNTIRTWDLQNDSIQIDENEDPSVFSFDRNSQLLAARIRGDGIVRKLNLDGNKYQCFKASNNFVQAITTSQNYIAIAEESNIRLGDINCSSIDVALHKLPIKGINSIAFSSDNNYLIGAGSNKTLIMHLWSLSGKSLDSYPLKVEQRKYDWSIELVDFSADNKYIVAGISTDEYGFSGYLQLFDIKGNRIGKAFGRGWQFALSPDGKYIAAQDNNNTIQLWDMKGNLVGSHFRGHEASIISLAFSPDGYFIASGSKDGTVRLWDTKGNLISTFLGQGLIQSVMFSSDGQYIASSSYDGTIKLWPANWKSALKLACNRLKYHPVLTAPQTEEEKSAARVCFLK